MFKPTHLSETLRHTFATALRTFALLAVAGMAFSVAHAQTAAVSTDESSSSSSSSSSVSADATTTEAQLTALPALSGSNFFQYGGGQRKYGRPRYRGSNATDDGTPKYTFEAGVGLVQPVGNTWHYFTPSYGFQFGGGRNFNSKLGLLLQFDYDHLGLTGQTLSNQSELYFSDPNPSDNGLDGNAHIWSFTLNPVYTISNGSHGGFGEYLVAGVGFYHKVSNFTLPQQACLDYYCLYTGYVQTNADHYSSNAPGFNAGFGVTYKFSRFSNERFFGEVRYVFVDNSNRVGYVYKPGTSAGTPTPTGPNADPNNFFPANSHHTTYFPVKFGIRF